MNPQNERRLPARFFYEAIENKFETKKQGRPIFDEVLYINIIRPGDKTTDVIREATDKDKQNYAQELALFLQKGELAIHGTPIEQLTFLNRAKIAEMKAMNIFTVEALAQIDDRSAYMGWRNDKNAAVAYLARARDQAEVTKWEEQKIALETRAANQDAKIAALQAQLEQLTAGQAGEPKRGPGRPRKDEAA